MESAVKLTDLESLKTKYKTLLDSRAWCVWLFAGLFYGYQFILRVSPSVMTDDLMRDFAVDACGLGVLASFYYIIYSSLQIPVGMLLDRYGPTKILRVAVFLCTLGSLVFAWAPTFFLASVGRLLIGAGAASAFLGALKLGTLWFPPERLSVIVASTLVIGKMGAVAGGAPLSMMMHAFGWRPTMLMIGAAGLVLTLCIWLFLSDGPKLGSKYAASRPVRANVQVESMKQTFQNLWAIVTSRQVWIISLYGSFMYVPLSAFADVWGVPFLEKAYNIDKTTAALASSMIFIGAGCGSPVMAFLTDLFQSRRIPMAISAALSVAINVIIVFVPGLPLSAMYVLVFLAGASFTGQTLIFASVCDFVSDKATGTALGFVNMIVMLSGVIAQPAIGWLVDFAADGVMNNGIPLYTVSDYRFALSVVPISLAIALAFVPLMKETYKN